MHDILNNAAEKDLKEAIINLVIENEYLQQENRRLEERIELRPVNIFVDKKGYLLFIETDVQKKMNLKRYTNIYNYFREKELVHILYYSGIPVIQIDLSKHMIYKLMGRGVI